MMSIKYYCSGVTHTSVLFVLGLLLVGCASTPGSTTDMVPVDEGRPLYEVAIDIDTLQKRYLLLSNVLTNSQLIQLETTNESLLDGVVGLKVYDQKIFVLDGQGIVFAFDLSGNFLFQVGAVGKGPGEFIKVDSWDIDRINHKLIFLDNAQQKLLFFDTEGKFIAEERFPSIYSSDMASLGEDRIVFYNDFNTANRNLPYALLFCDLTSKKITQTAFPIEWIQSGTYISESPFAVNNGEIYFKQCHSYDIYRIDETGISPYFFVDFGEYSLPEQFLTKEFDDKREDFRHEQIYEQKRYVGTIMSDHITDDYIQYQFTVGGTYYYGLYAKANGSNQVYSGVRNDIYDLPIPGITLMPGNRAYGIVSPGLLYQYKDFIDNDKYDLPERMKEYLEEINLSDNPAVIIGEIGLESPR